MDIRVKGPRAGGDLETLVRVGDLGGLAELFAGERVLVVADPLALRIHGNPLPSAPLVTVPRGEEAKTLPALAGLWEAFLEKGLDRSSSVLAFGGGATCDLVGFAASTYMRGLAVDYVPTTLLAMVDASVGGKTGIDFGERKNLVGTFSAPRNVFMEVAFLDTLSDTEFASGMAEVAKHAVIAGGEAFDYLEKTAGERPRAAAKGGRALLERIVADSVRIKADIVVRDPREDGDRRMLNLGHTYGHALESTLGIAHGLAVSAGLATACRLAEKRGELAKTTVSRILSLLGRLGLPDSVAAAAAVAGLPDGEKLRRRAAGTMAADKKKKDTMLLFAMPKAIGRVEIVEVPLAALEDFLMEAP
jgi:3-dehydroquinate synthase